MFLYLFFWRRNRLWFLNSTICIREIIMKFLEIKERERERFWVCVKSKITDSKSFPPWKLTLQIDVKKKKKLHTKVSKEWFLGKKISNLFSEKRTMMSNVHFLLNFNFMTVTVNSISDNLCKGWNYSKHLEAWNEMQARYKEYSKRVIKRYLLILLQVRVCCD